MVALWSISFLVLLGCGGQTENLQPVTGSVSFKEKRLDHGSLRFFGADGRPIGSVIQEDGTFQVELPPGEYQVSVSSPPLPPAGGEIDTPAPPSPDDLPAKYAQPVTSGLSLTVNRQEGAVSYEIELQ